LRGSSATGIGRHPAGASGASAIAGAAVSESAPPPTPPTSPETCPLMTLVVAAPPAPPAPPCPEHKPLKPAIDQLEEDTPEEKTKTTPEEFAATQRIAPGQKSASLMREQLKRSYASSSIQHRYSPCSPEHSRAAWDFMRC
jgi:hypothetical protein